MYVCMYLAYNISKRTWRRPVSVCILEIILSISNPCDNGKKNYMCMYVCMKAWDPREMWCGVDYHPWRLQEFQYPFLRLGGCMCCGGLPILRPVLWSERLGHATGGGNRLSYVVLFICVYVCMYLSVCLCMYECMYVCTLHFFE